MCSKGFFRRMLPFFATFAVGIFIASLFGFGGPRFRGRGWERHQMFERIQMENEDLKMENMRLRNQLESEHINFDGFQLERLHSGRSVGPEVPVVGPMPVMRPMPTAPHTHR